MIVKSFSFNKLNKDQSTFFLFYGENEGQKEELINNIFLKDFTGEFIKYDENQILENEDIFLETCLNESLFEKEKIILVSRVTAKLFGIIEKISEKKIFNKKIILSSGLLEKRSKIRQFFENEKKLICVPFYQDKELSLINIANHFFKKNNISISSENINLIIDKCSGDRRNLKNEMDKILNYCLNKKTISNDEIIKLINLNHSENYFELIDNCLAKNHKKVCKIINNNSFGKTDSIILIRSFISRLKRLIELKKLADRSGNSEEVINKFRPPIFWKDKEIVKKQINNWTISKIYNLLDDANNLEINFKNNYEFSNNLIFDIFLNTSNS